MAYSEHVGVKRHDGGRRGEIIYLYPRNNPIAICLKVFIAMVTHDQTQPMMQPIDALYERTRLPVR